MIQRHHSISGRGSVPGGGGGAAAAAAAAAATAATATAYTHISSKLEGIEALIAALKVRGVRCLGCRSRPDLCWFRRLQGVKNSLSAPPGTSFQLFPINNLDPPFLAFVPFAGAIPFGNPIGTEVETTSVWTGTYVQVYGQSPKLCKNVRSCLTGGARG